MFNSINVLVFTFKFRDFFFICLFICWSHCFLIYFFLDEDSKIIEPLLIQIQLIEAGQLQGSIG